jgi:uncharacterized integral membrane protein
MMAGIFAVLLISFILKLAGLGRPAVGDPQSRARLPHAVVAGLTMRRMSRAETPIVVALDRLVLRLMLAILAAILTAAMVLQYAFGEIPCPLCLLQRVAMFGCCFGLIRQLRAGLL